MVCSAGTSGAVCPYRKDHVGQTEELSPGTSASREEDTVEADKE